MASLRLAAPFIPGHKGRGFLGHSYKAGFGERSPGGVIAGRDTILYQRKVNRPESDETSQLWLDAETDLVLKSHVSVFPKQGEKGSREETLECRTLLLGPQKFPRAEKFFTEFW